MKPRHVKGIIQLAIYDTDNSTLLAGDDYFDGKNWERHGTNRFLYRTRRGNYFLVTQGQIKIEDEITYLDLLDAAQQFFGLKNKRMSFKNAFPGLKLEEG